MVCGAFLPSPRALGVRDHSRVPAPPDASSARPARARRPYEVSFGRLVGTVGPGTRRILVTIDGRLRPRKPCADTGSISLLRCRGATSL